MVKTKIAIGTALALIATTASAQVRVKPYVKKDGTYVSGSTRSAPNNTKLDNYSAKGNVNPSTGKSGTVDPWKPAPWPKPK